MQNLRDLRKGRVKRFAETRRLAHWAHNIKSTLNQCDYNVGSTLIQCWLSYKRINTFCFTAQSETTVICGKIFCTLMVKPVCKCVIFYLYTTFTSKMPSLVASGKMTNNIFASTSSLDSLIRNGIKMIYFNTSNYCGHQRLNDYTKSVRQDKKVENCTARDCCLIRQNLQCAL